MKSKNLNIGTAVYPKTDGFVRAQFTRGLPLSVIGLFVYAFLRLAGKKPRDYRGICKYFEIGRGWGGMACGWFFVCAEDSGEHVMSHEVGHGIFNANIGGFRTLFFSAGSVVRYWYRRLFRVKTAYDSWWFESVATDCGAEYVRRVLNKEI